MTQERWTEVDHYFTDTLHLEDKHLQEALAASDRAGLPTIAVSAPQGALLNLMARSIRATKILEVGTLGGYSTICLARALPATGKVISLEIDAKHADVARSNLAHAGLAERAEVRLGRAADSLEQIVAKKEGPFDLIFIDADKPSNPVYFAYALKLSRPGSIIIVDNVVRHGAVADANSSDAAVKAVRELTSIVAAERRVSATAMQTVGNKGHDGFMMILVNE